MKTETRFRWMITTNGKRFAMVGSPRTHSEALAYARGIWPGCVVE